MQTSVYGMAVLCLRLIILGMSLLIFRGVNWNQLMRQNAKQGAYAVYVMVSLAVGHSAADNQPNMEIHVQIGRAHV